MTEAGSTSKTARTPSIVALTPAGLWQQLRQLAGSSAHLLRMHWLPVLAISVAGIAAHSYLKDFAIVAARYGAVPGLLALALVPFSTLVTLIAALLVLRRRENSRTVLRDVITALGTALLPFLVVYQSSGGLTDDMRFHMREGFFDDLSRLGIEGVQGTPRIPVATSWIVLATVAVAVVARIVAESLVEDEKRWRDLEDPRRLTLQIVAGYFELVWIILGAFVITFFVSTLGTWWETRRIVHGFRQWWDRLRDSLPSLTIGTEEAIDWGQLALTSAGTVLLVPLAWLLIGTIIYGIQSSRVAILEELPTGGNGRNARLGARFSTLAADPRVQRSWQQLRKPYSRIGLLLAAAGMIARAGWGMIAVFCALYTLISILPYGLWALLRQLLPNLDRIGWQAWADTIESAGDVITTVLSAVLLAAAADQLLHHFGAPPSLREVPLRFGRRGKRHRGE